MAEAEAAVREAMGAVMPRNFLKADELYAGGDLMVVMVGELWYVPRLLREMKGLFPALEGRVA